MFLLKTALIAATLLFTPVADAGAHEECTTSEMIAKVYAEHKLAVVKIEGKELATFNQAYEAKFSHAAPTGVAVLLLVEHGEKTQVLSFNEANCLTGVGNAPTEIIHELLGKQI